MGELIDLATYRTARDAAEVERLKEEVRALLRRVYPIEAELFWVHGPFVDIRSSCKIPVDVVE
jgi:hypothetical protein